MTDDAAVELFESLVEEYKARLRNGESPSVQEYAERYPELGAEIVAIFPTVASMENLKRHREGEGRDHVPALLPPFRRIGEYRIVREIGRGGMGVVYEAFQKSLNRSVAIKVLPWLRNADETALKRFNREARVAAGLEHPNIVPIFGFGVEEGTHYFAMRYIRGAGLDQVIRHLAGQGLALRGGAAPLPAGQGQAAPLPASLLREIIAGLVTNGGDIDQKSLPGGAGGRAAAAGPPAGVDARRALKDLPPAYYREIAALVAQVARALNYAHGQGALHRDIKPANLLVDGQGTAWLADFGIAKMEGSDTLTVAGGVFGTVRYMAPEVFDGKVEPRSDLYSLGLVLYELATLRPAFAGQGTALIPDIVRGELTPPGRLNPYLPNGLETIILKAVARDPEDRFPDGQAMAVALDGFAQGRLPEIPPALAVTPAVARTKVQPATGKRFGSLAVSLLLLASGVLLFLLLRGVFANRPGTPGAAPAVAEKAVVPRTAPAGQVRPETASAPASGEAASAQPPPPARRPVSGEGRQQAEQVGPVAPRRAPPPGAGGRRRLLPPPRR